MPSNLRFEYPTRWMQVGEDLTSQDPDRVRHALTLLDDRDKWLEDHWPAPSSGGGAPVTYNITGYNDSALIVESGSSTDQVISFIPGPGNYLTWWTIYPASAGGLGAPIEGYCRGLYDGSPFGPSQPFEGVAGSFNGAISAAGTFIPHTAASNVGVRVHNYGPDQLLVGFTFVTMLVAHDPV